MELQSSTAAPTIFFLMNGLACEIEYQLHATL